jgi:hypothetical protein
VLHLYWLTLLKLRLKYRLLLRFYCSNYCSLAAVVHYNLDRLLHQLYYTTVAVAMAQLLGDAPVSQIVYVTVYVPDGVFGATVKSPLASTLGSVSYWLHLC